MEIRRQPQESVLSLLLHVCALGTKLRLSGWVASVLTPLSHLTDPHDTFTVPIQRVLEKRRQGCEARDLGPESLQKPSLLGCEAGQFW